MDLRWTVIVILAAAGLAGCIGANPSGAGADAGPTSTSNLTVPVIPDRGFANAIDDTHAHEVPELHTDAHNLELVDFSPVTDGLDPAAYGSGFSEVDVQDGRVLVSSVEGQRGFSILEIGDDGLTTQGHVYGGAETWDTRFSDDGNWAFMGCQGGGRYGAYGGDNAIGGCTSGARPQAPVEGDYHASGIVAVDVSDPENPEPVAYTPSQPVHNLYTATINGTIVVANHDSQLFVFHPDDPRFEQVSTIPATHDVAIQQHPLTGEWLLYTGNTSGGSGISIWNIDDPTDPVPVSTIHEGELGRKIVGWHEQTPSPGLIDGRHITVAAGEQFGGLPGPVSVIDTTDPTEPKLLGQWQIPGRYSEQRSYKFSNHNVDISEDGQVAIGMYHAGVWVFDISTQDRQAYPPTLGFYQPHEVNPAAGQQPSPYGAFTGSPYVWGAQWTDDGQLVVPDLNSGVYLLEPTWETTTVSS